MNFDEDALQQVREDRLLLDQVDLWLYEEILPFIGQRIVEIGCGVGNFTDHFLGKELYIGTDVSAESVVAIKNRYPERENFFAFIMDATTQDFLTLREYSPDTVFSLNVFEHIEDHQAALNNAVEILQPGGTVILVVPAHAFLFGKIDQSIGHYRRYDKKQIRAMFNEAGIRADRLKYLNSLGAIGWFVNSRLMRRTVPPAGQLRIFNKLVPTLRSIEDKIGTPIGISILAVGFKEDHQ